MKDRDSNAGGVHRDGVILKNLLCLPHHFHLFPRVAIILKRINMRQRVERNLLRIDL